MKPLQTLEKHSVKSVNIPNFWHTEMLENRRVRNHAPFVWPFGICFMVCRFVYVVREYAPYAKA